LSIVSYDRKLDICEQPSWGLIEYNENLSNNKEISIIERAVKVNPNEKNSQIFLTESLKYSEHKELFMLIDYTQATLNALTGLRDLTSLEWYVIPLLAIVFYIYAIELKKARTTGNWDIISCGLTVFGMDFFNETWNGWVMVLTNRSAFWTTPGETALRVMVGWNIEIIFMFLINGIVFAYMLEKDEKKRILGIPNRWFYAVVLAAFCVIIEVLLNVANVLIWEYPFWNRSFGGVWLIFLIGYFHFYVACILILKIKNLKKSFMAIGAIYSVAILMNIIAAIAGWVY